MSSDRSPLWVPKASDVLAEQLRQRILDGDLRPGQMLPYERNLAEESGLSRTVVREALRILEIEGLVSTRPGRNGGTAVRRPDEQSLARSLNIFIRGRRMRFQEVLEAREHIEPYCAQLAAERRTGEELTVLEELTAQLRECRDDVQLYLTENTRWHVTVARLSHNELLGAFMLALSQAVRAATDIENFNSPRIISGAFDAHDRILDAIRRGDGPAARRAMERHVSAFRDEVMEFPHPDEVELDSAEGTDGTENARDRTLPP